MMAEVRPRSEFAWELQHFRVMTESAAVGTARRKATADGKALRWWEGPSLRIGSFLPPCIQDTLDLQTDAGIRRLCPGPFQHRPSFLTPECHLHVNASRPLYYIKMEFCLSFRGTLSSSWVATGSTELLWPPLPGMINVCPT